MWMNIKVLVVKDYSILMTNWNLSYYLDSSMTLSHLYLIFCTQTHCSLIMNLIYREIEEGIRKLKFISRTESRKRSILQILFVEENQTLLEMQSDSLMVFRYLFNAHMIRLVERRIIILTTMIRCTIMSIILHRTSSLTSGVDHSLYTLYTIQDCK